RRSLGATDCTQPVAPGSDPMIRLITPQSIMSHQNYETKPICLNFLNNEGSPDAGTKNPRDGLETLSSTSSDRPRLLPRPSPLPIDEIRTINPTGRPASREGGCEW